MRVDLLSVQLHQSPQVPHGLLQEGVHLKHGWELANPLPCPEAEDKTCLLLAGRAGHLSGGAPSVRAAPGDLTHLTRWQICARLLPLLSEGQSL